MDQVSYYIENLKDNARNWMDELVQMMRRDYPDMKESFAFGMPTYIGEGLFISFEVKRRFIYLFTNDIMLSSYVKNILPDAKAVNDYTKIKYDGDITLEKLKTVCRDIIVYNSPERSRDNKQS